MSGTQAGRRSRWAASASGAALALAAAGCATKPPPPPVVAAPPPAPAVTAPPAAAPATPPTPDLAPRERLRKVLELLDAGQRDQARADAQELVKQSPDDALPKSLLNQIDADPKVLLGAQSFPYKIKPGETLSLLAERFLGDKYLFYALARYNGIDAPRSAEVGQMIQIPGAPRDLGAQPSRRKAPEAAPLRRPAPAPTPAPAAPVRDAARAGSLRSRALVSMNRGQINEAVGLLRQAAELDPGNPAIARDLSRAVRLQAGSQH